MKISETLPILSKMNALFLVAGAKTAIIYQLRNGEINEQETLEVTTPSYSDNEGRFESHGPRGRLQASGSSYKSNTEYVRALFLDEILSSLKKIKKSYSAIYLFAPSHVIKQIEGALLPKDFKKIKKTFLGNFTKQHPTTLLEKVGISETL